MSEKELHNCQYCGKDYESGTGYSEDYCSEECWEADTNYGETA